MKFSERREAALAKCNKICSWEYGKYLRATEAARSEWFEENRKIDAEIDALQAASGGTNE